MDGSARCFDWGTGMVDRQFKWYKQSLELGASGFKLSLLQTQIFLCWHWSSICLQIAWWSIQILPIHPHLFLASDHTLTNHIGTRGNLSQGSVIFVPSQVCLQTYLAAMRIIVDKSVSWSWVLLQHQQFCKVCYYDWAIQVVEPTMTAA